MRFEPFLPESGAEPLIGGYRTHSGLTPPVHHWMIQGAHALMPADSLDTLKWVTEAASRGHRRIVLNNGHTL